MKPVAIVWPFNRDEHWKEFRVLTASLKNLEKKLAALSGVEHISVWRHNQVPAELQYGTSNRCGDVIVAPDLGWQFASDPKNKIGAHGYSPKEKEMQVPFIAVGPSFQSGCSSIDYIFKNVDIYAMLADILGISPAPTDGDLGNTSVLRCQ